MNIIHVKSPRGDFADGYQADLTDHLFLLTATLNTFLGHQEEIPVIPTPEK